MIRSAAAALLLAIACVTPAARAQVASPPEIVGPLIGPGSQKVQPGLAFFGADLGWTVEHQGELRILFGDTDDVFNAVCFPQLHNDDSEGTLPLPRPEVGVPPVTMLTDPNDPDVLQRLIVVRKGESLAMGYGQVPVSAYSDGENLAMIAGRGGTIHCAAGFTSPVAACRGPLSDHPDFLNWLAADGLRCSQTLGECTPAPNGIPTACTLATGDGCNAFLGEVCTPTDTGLCVDSSSSQNDGTPSSERFTAGNEMEFAIEDPANRGHYESLATLRTAKFINTTARTVRRFTFLPFGDDYRPGSGALLVWGRPGFSGEQGRQAQIYLLVHKLPIERAPNGRWRFQPWYYAGTNARTGLPIWSRQQANAKPLALDGVVAGSPFEEQPLVNQFSVSWVGGSIRKWVMLYGGNIGDYLLADPAHDRPGAGPGSVRIRFASHPWGPWSPPQPHLLEGSPTEVGSPLGPGGVLFHPLCVDQPGAPCARSDEVRPIDFYFGCFPIGKTFDNGFFYGANIIDAYTEPDGGGGMNLYWNVSTWNPYGVVYLKTNLQPGP
ncbi:MAG: hypothetical protein ACHQ6T_07600 [Myxococcota bacterium]